MGNRNLNTLRIISLFSALCFAIATINTAQATTGTRMKSQDESPTEIADRHYRRGLKAANKADGYIAKAVEQSNEKKRQSLFTKSDKQLKKAIKLYRKALDYKPSMSIVHSDLGKALVKTGQFEAAIPVLDDAINAARASVQTLSFQTEALICIGQADQANKVYSELMDLDSDAASEFLKYASSVAAMNRNAGSAELQKWLAHQNMQSSATRR